MKKKRTGTIDLLKFIFAIIVVLYHSAPFFLDPADKIFKGGFIAVEFYFIVSGYLLAAKASKFTQGNFLDANLQMLWSKVKHVFPYIFLAGMTSNVLYIYDRFSVNGFLENLLMTSVDTLGLQMFGFKGYIASGVSWYLSALFIVSFLVYPLLCKNRTLFTKYIAPLSVMFIYGYIAHANERLLQPGEWWTFVHNGMLRGYAGIAVGCMAYEFCQWLNVKSTVNQYVVGSVEILGYLVAILFSAFAQGSSLYDFFIIPLLFFSISISFSNKSILGRVFCGKIYNALGIFSLSIYLNHFFVREFLVRVFPEMPGSKMLVCYLLIALCLACVNQYFGNMLAKGKHQFIKYLAVVLVTFMLAGLGAQMDSIVMCSRLRGFDGRGTASAPFQVDSKEKLEQIRDMVNDGEDFSGIHFLQTENIDLQNGEWIPIGQFGTKHYFDGIYDGGNHYIENLLITENNPDPSGNVGLFGVLLGTVKNLGIESGSVSGKHIGAIASHSGGDHALILNCYNKADVSATKRAGGICDNFEGGSIVNCANVGKVTAPTCGPIFSYGAECVQSIYPFDAHLPETFKGTYEPVEMQGETVQEILNSGLKQLNEQGSLVQGEAADWNAANPDL